MSFSTECGFAAVWLSVSLLLGGGCRAADAGAAGTELPAGSAAAGAAQVRIVDFGHDFLRAGDGRPVHQFHVHRHRLDRDPDTGLYRPVRPVWREWKDVEVDGDPATSDLIGAMPFSMEQPVSPVAPWYDRLAGTPRWYGGAAIYKANTDELFISENGVNQEHDGPRHYPRDNWALFHEIYEVDAPYRLCGLWVWKKEDFLNGGDEFPVTFDTGSELALYLQRYFMGVDGVRFVVRDGEQFYVSERVVQGAGQVRGSGNGKQHVLCPLETRWAEYSPKAPYRIRFDPGKADFQVRSFEDVTAVGFYAFKDRFIPAYFGFKWYAFEADALVRRPERPSEHMRMSPVEGDIDTPPFYVSTTEVPYELWKNVFRLARSNTFVRNPRGFIFRNDGDMGSMDYPGPDGELIEHALQEPVTDLTLHDIAAWCNALSVQESRTPCYYVDPENRKPFHCVIQSPLYRHGADDPPLYVKWDADGYRLPTPEEWQIALGEQRMSGQAAWTESNSAGSTHPVAQKMPNRRGVHDMLGNVWEVVWPYGGEYSPRQSDEPLLCVGGGFTYPREPDAVSANPHGDRPWRGSFQVGFRPVRRATGHRMPRPRPLDERIPRWEVKHGELTAAGDDAGKPAVDLVRLPGQPLEVARTETTYGDWKRVRDWAVAHGYSFDHDGDMGSMDWWGYADRPVVQTHGPDEPVTDIALYDACAWCNALSEMTGREPVYYDEDRRQVYRAAFVYRPLMMLFFEAGSANEMDLIDYSPAKAYQELYVKPDADGYRLPTTPELSAAAGIEDGARYSWGRDAEGVFASAWLFDTAGGTTHPVGHKRPNALGLHDVEGNVSEMCMGNAPVWDVFGRATCPRVGGSFQDLTLGLRPDKPPFSPTGWGYPDIGFRVVRQVPQTETARPVGGGANVHAPLASASMAATGESRLRIDPDGYDPLQGRVYRGNLRRDGVFQASGLRKLHGLKWRFRTGGPVRSSPVVVDGAVYFGSLDGCVYAVDAETGRRVWKAQTGGPVAGSAAVVDGAVYIASEDGVVHALDAADGSEKWIAGFSRRAPAGSPAVVDGVVFICAGSGGGHDTIVMTSGPTVGLDADTGEKVWESDWGGQGYVSPAIDRGVLCTTDQNHWGGVDLATGRLLWQVTASGQSRDFATGAIHGDYTYGIGSIGGDVMCVSLDKGRRLWHQFTWPRQVAVTNDGEPGHEVLAGPAVAHGRVYVPCNDGRLHTFDAETGERGWAFETRESIQSAPAVAGEVVYFGCHDGHLYALNAHTGEQIWTFEAGAPIKSSPWPTGDGVYFGCDDGYLYAVH